MSDFAHADRAIDRVDGVGKIAPLLSVIFATATGDFAHPTNKRSKEDSPGAAAAGAELSGVLTRGASFPVQSTPLYVIDRVPRG